MVALVITLSTGPAAPQHTENDTVHSEEYGERRNTSLNLTHFISTTFGHFLPYAVIVPLIVLFNINLVSGPGHSFLFFYQTLKLAVYNLKFFSKDSQIDQRGYPSLTENITDVLSLHEIPLEVTSTCLQIERTFNLQECQMIYIATGYVRVLLILIYLLIIWLLIHIKSCPILCCSKIWAKIRRSVRNFREKNIKSGSLLTGTGSVLVICYGYIIQISFRLARLYVHSCYGNETSKKWCWLSHPGKAIVIVSLALPITLLYYPNLHNILSRITQRITNKSLPRYAKLDPVFDTFQGCYKPKLRFFAGLYMVYRLLLWSSLLFTMSEQGSQYILTLMMLTILIIHSLLQPFRKPKYNYMETITLLSLVFLSSLTGFAGAQLNPNESRDDALLSLILIIALSPLVLGICYNAKHVVQWYIGRKESPLQCLRVRWNHRHSQQKQDTSEQINYVVAPDQERSFKQEDKVVTKTTWSIS